MTTTAADRRTGMLFALGAYLSWGLVPLYWRALGPVPPFELLAHRVLWSLVLAVAALLIQGRLSTALRPLATRRTAITLAASTLLIGANWVVFILAVQTGRLLHASLGYYISPLVSVVFGLGFLGERLRPGQKVAVALAVVGVLVLVVAARVLPWIAVALAVSFALYGLLRKVAPVDALVGLYLETLLLAPLAAGYLFVRARSGVHRRGCEPHGPRRPRARGAHHRGPAPLLHRRDASAPAVDGGLLLSPTSQFLIAVVVFGETATRTHLLAFAFIWASMAVFVVEARRAAPSPP